MVEACLRTEWEPPTLRASLLTSTRPARAPPSWPPASPATRKRVCAATGYAWLRVSRWCSMEEAKNRSRSSREVQNRCGLLTGHQAVQVTAVSCLAERAAHVKVLPRRSRRHRRVACSNLMTILTLCTPSRAVGVDALLRFRLLSAHSRCHIEARGTTKLPSPWLTEMLLFSLSSESDWTSDQISSEVPRTEFHRILYSGFSRPGCFAMTIVAHGHTELQTGFFATRSGHREVQCSTKIDLSGPRGLQTLCQLRSCPPSTSSILTDQSNCR